MLSSANDRVSAGDGLRLWFWRVATVMMTGTPVAAWSQSDPSTAAPTPAPTPLPSAASPATPTLSPVGPVDLTPWGMYLNADPVVKAVLIGLLVASVVTWTIWLAKTVEILAARRRVQAALHALSRARTTVEGAERMADRKGEVRRLIEAATMELKLSADVVETEGIKERVASRLERTRSELRAAHLPRYRRAGDHRRHRTVRRTVRHRLGHHEQLHRHLEVADHQPRGGCARHRRSAAGHRLRACRRHSGRGDLQRVRPADHRLSCVARRCIGRGVAAGQPRSRSPARRIGVAGSGRPLPRCRPRQNNSRVSS